MSMSTRERCVRTNRCRALAAIVVAATMLTSAAEVEAAPCWRPPVEGRVVDAFRAPPCTWCAGNRGLDYEVDGNVTVSAAASGRVEFVGSVAGINYVVIRLPNGWRHTYGQLNSSRQELGDAVLAGAVIGQASGRFFFGLRIGDDYADPAPYIGVLRARPRLVPVDATPPRPAPPARPTCLPLASTPDTKPPARSSFR